jgi:Tol biopolymer transport system component
MKSILLSACIFVGYIAFSQQPPATDIYLFDLHIRRNNIRLANPKNITARKGYDNQPFFHPEKPLLYYASAGEDGRTDIMIYNYQTDKTSQLTYTADREYSPTVTPDGRFISCIIQRDNGAQDLGKYPAEGGGPVILVDNLMVGYHAWVNEHELLLFVLGQPNTLRLYHVNTREDKILAHHIGRSLHRIPGTGEMSFVEKQTDNWFIKKYNPKSGKITTISTTLPGREDLTWTPDGKICMSDGVQLYYLTPGSQASWKSILMPKGIALKNITRIAVNATGTRLAVVAEE